MPRSEHRAFPFEMSVVLPDAHPAGGDDSLDVLMARADRLLARHRSPDAEPPVLTETIPPPPRDDDIPLLMDVLPIAPIPAEDAASTSNDDPLIDQALAGSGLALDDPRRAQLRRALEDALRALPPE